MTEFRHRNFGHRLAERIFTFFERLWKGELSQIQSSSENILETLLGALETIIKDSIGLAMGLNLNPSARFCTHFPEATRKPGALCWLVIQHFLGSCDILGPDWRHIDMNMLIYARKTPKVLSSISVWVSGWNVRNSGLKIVSLADKILQKYIIDDDNMKTNPIWFVFILASTLLQLHVSSNLELAFNFAS